MAALILIFTPIFLPVATQFGISPIHFGIMLMMNQCQRILVDNPA
ncbi:TRAP transporter large permease subunit [Chromohalobacter canadensis]|uniref:Tripartite ATP-independent transporter, DctM component n=1 Tax=Chromohalobacter canadensis TaxID=141389 RepID=A0A285VYK2_9GAMM|nr:TRAP transporter large permease subunit [Chromohalobacter canadensis]SOC57751.1 Tripartite ATP-independent transporter, DctM component [Chromohalobacter canadensis]